MSADAVAVLAKLRLLLPICQAHRPSRRRVNCVSAAIASLVWLMNTPGGVLGFRTLQRSTNVPLVISGNTGVTATERAIVSRWRSTQCNSACWSSGDKARQSSITIMLVELEPYWVCRRAHLERDEMRVWLTWVVGGHHQGSTRSRRKRSSSGSGTRCA